MPTDYLPEPELKIEIPAPLISVGIPTLNRCEYVVRAINSVLNQTYSHIEVVVSDNASTDATANAVRAINDGRIVFIRQTQNIGMTNNFNACLQASKGALFLMLSDDDMLEPEAIEKLSRPFREPFSFTTNNSIGVTWSPITIVDEVGITKYVSASGPRIEQGWRLVEGLFRGTRGPRFCSVMVRREDALKVGGYQEKYGPICDEGNWTQIACLYPNAVCIAQPLARYTIHPGSVTASEPDGALWQRSGECVVNTLVEVLKIQGNSYAARKIANANSTHIFNLLASIIMQRLGKPGWLRYCIKEVVRAPRYMLSPFAMKRILADGWKLILLGKR